MKSLFSLLTLGFLLLGSSLLANQTDCELKGRVVDNLNGLPIAYATIVLLERTDSSFVMGTTSDNEGLFHINKIEPDDYLVKVSFIGYADFFIEDLSFHENNRSIHLGQITLSMSSELLQEIEIKGKTSSVSYQLDKQLIDVQSDISAIGGTAIDALKLSPSIQVDAEGKLNLRGSPNFTVLLDGKPTSLSSEEVLRQTPANQISKIEVITHPSAKYNAEGGAGIINILLKKGAGQGFNAVANTSVGTKSKYTADISFNLNREKLKLSAGFSMRDYTKSAINNYSRILKKSNYAHHAFLGQDRSFVDDQISFRLGLNYSRNKNQEFNYSVHLGQSALRGIIAANSSGLTIPESEREYKHTSYGIVQEPTFLTQNVNYNRRFNNNANISINAFYSYIDYYLNTNQSSFIADENYQIHDDTPYLQDILNDNYSHDAKLNLDYTLPINKISSFEIGLAGRNYSRFLDISFAIFDHEQMNWVNHADYSNSYDFLENVYAAYFNFNYLLFGWQITTGGRFEYMDRILSQRTADEEYSYDKFHFFPAMSISKTINEKHQIQISTSHRINRPDEYLMNPFPEFEDDYFFSIGNPNLAPEIVRSGEFSYKNIGENSVLTTNFFIRHINDKIEQKISLRADDKIVTSFHNDNRDRTIGMEFMANIELTEGWTVNASASISHYKIWGKIDGIKYEFNNRPWNLQMVHSVKIKSASSIQLTGYYQSKTVRTQGHLSDYFGVDISLKHSFLAGRLSAGLHFKDVFQTLNYQLNTETETMHLTGDFLNESPVLLMSIGYRFSEYKKMTKDVETKFDM